jgi:superfamily II DNA or RNA helicase
MQQGNLMQTEINLLKNGNFLIVEPTDDDLFLILEEALSFDEKIKLYGAEAYKRKKQNRPTFEVKRHTLLTLDHKSRIVTSFGFWSLIRDKLKAAGYKVKITDLSPPDPAIFTPCWKNIERFKLRDNQPEFVQKVLTHRCGRFDCPPGFGKSFMIGIICALFPKAKIDVVSRRVAVLRDRIYPELIRMVGDVGIVGGGKKVTNRRVMCYTVGSMEHSPATADILIGDEVHELAADFSAGLLMNWANSRNYGLSASHDMRYDGKDLRMHGIFGPIVFRVDYQQAVAANLVVPIEVHWSHVVMDYDPCYGYEDVEKKRMGIWQNDYRNQVIAQDARKYDENTQVLITVDTIEHAMQLKRLLPEYQLVYMENGLTPEARAKYAKSGCCSSDEPLMDVDRRKYLTEQFKFGKLKKVIATTVWNVGVSFDNLSVLIRAAGGGSAINDIQIPGRVSRISDGKTRGIVHDYLDQFNRGMKSQASRRAKSYADNDWKQVFPRPGLMEEFLG